MNHPPCEIKQFGASDALALSAAVRCVHGQTASTAWLSHWLEDGTRHAVAAFVGTDPVGLAYAYELPRLKSDAAALLLYEIDVLEEHRRQGVGTTLINALLAIAHERYLDSTWLLTDDGNPAALALYAGTGGRRNDVDQVMFQFPA
jgi:ribosomal protein S18 acetylase RimI-like enzyme